MTRFQILRKRLGIVPQPYVPHPEIIDMSYSAIAAVPTASGSKYLQQLCKHWQHNMPVEFTPERGTVTFPKNARGADHPGDGIATFDAKPDTLDVRIDASSEEQLNGLKGAVARHLDRFAFREAPLRFDWQGV